MNKVVQVKFMKDFIDFKESWLVLITDSILHLSLPLIPLL